MNKIMSIVLIAFVGLIGMSNSVMADNDYTLDKGGCCSHHRGVCGCSGNRDLCCDGSLSPSCRC